MTISIGREKVEGKEAYVLRSGHTIIGVHSTTKQIIDIISEMRKYGKAMENRPHYSSSLNKEEIELFEKERNKPLRSLDEL